MRTNYRWIGLRSDIYYELEDLGQFGDSFSDILSRLLNSYYVRQEVKANGPTAVGRDEIKERLKKFDSHTKGIAKVS